MKICLTPKGKYDATFTLDVSTSHKSDINMLILVHVAFFIIYTAMRWCGVLEIRAGEGTIGDFVNQFIALPGRSSWPGGIITHPFIHSNVFEFLVSMGVLWIFGHLLAALVGERRVMMLYVISTIIPAVVFLLSHYVFRVFSGHGMVMDGAFAGAAGIMAATAVLYSSYSIRLFGRTFVPLWQLFVVILVISMALIMKHSIASFLTYAASVWIGGRFGVVRVAATQANVER